VVLRLMTDKMMTAEPPTKKPVRGTLSACKIPPNVTSRKAQIAVN